MNFHLKLDAESVEQLQAAAPLCVPPELSVREVMQLMQKHNCGAVLICQHARLVGIFTERDALHVMARRAPFEAPIREVMIASPVTLTNHDTVGRAIALMAQGGYRRLPVVDSQGAPLGIVKVSEILHHLVDHFPNVIYNLPPKPHHSTLEREGA